MRSKEYVLMVHFAVIRFDGASGACQSGNRRALRRLGGGTWDLLHCKVEPSDGMFGVEKTRGKVKYHPFLALL